MPKFRRKPVVIEAVQYNGFAMVDDVSTPMFDLSFDAPDWLVEAQGKTDAEAGAVYLDDMGRLAIVTLEGKMFASPNDYVIRGTQGEIYPCKPGIFDDIYEGAAEPINLEEAPEVAAMRYIEQLRAGHGSVSILCDDEEANTREEATAVDCIGDWTNWQERRFYGETIIQCLAKAAVAQAAWNSPGLD